jgi:acyl dehydratase
MTTILYFEDIAEGAVEWRGEADVDKEEMVAYAKMNDPWPVHIDEHSAKQTLFGSLTASGGYAITLWYRLSHPILNNRPERMALMAGVDWHVKWSEARLAALRPGWRRLVIRCLPISPAGRNQ